MFGGDPNDDTAKAAPPADDITEAPISNDAPVATKRARAAWVVNGIEYVFASVYLIILIIIIIALVFFSTKSDAGVGAVLKVVAFGAIVIGSYGLIWNARSKSHYALTECIKNKTC